MPPVERTACLDAAVRGLHRAKQIIAPALNSVVGGPSKLYEGSRGQIKRAIDALVSRAIDSGDIRKDLDPFDLLRH